MGLAAVLVKAFKLEEEGIKEGEMKKAVDTVRAALKKGLPEDVVAEITGLDLEAVRKLKADLN
jgi:MoaA/NifB/PqqE/SkfB family radical SAM enzyme